MAQSERDEDSQSRLMAVLLLLLLIGGGIGLFVALYERDGARPATVNHKGEEPEADVPTVKKGGPQPAANAPSEDPVKPPPDPEVKVEVPPLTPFRRLVFEADAVDELIDIDRKGLPSAQLPVIAAKLKEIKSEFAWYAQRRVTGPLIQEERSKLGSEAARAFENPDAYASSFERKEAARAHFWLYDGAILPAVERNPKNPDLPWKRRAHEPVSPELATEWLEAMESEFGETDFGKGEALPLDLVLFADAPRYLDFARKRLELNPPQWSVGFYSAGWDVVCAPITENASLAEVLRHEIFHALQARLAYKSLTCPWFAEGSAEWLDKAPPKDGKLSTHPGFALAARGYLRFLVDQGLKIELEKFLSLDIAGFYGEPELNYLTAFCFIDFLRSQKDLTPVYFEFWSKMKSGLSPQDALYQTFGALGYAELQRRFLNWLKESPAVQTPVRFTHDAPGDVKDVKWPASLGGTPNAGKQGEIGAGWYQALGKLQQHGFAGALGPSFIKGNYDCIVVACDHSESMGKPLEEATFDFEAFRRWLFCVRYAGSIKLTRKSESGENDEEVPAPILISLVEAVITNRVAEFTADTGIKIGEELQKQINTGWEEFYLTLDILKQAPRRQLCLYTAESVAWYWGVRQDKANVYLVAFNTAQQIENENNSFRGNAVKSAASPLDRLFDKTKAKISPIGSDGADTDWWLGFSGVLGSSSDLSNKRIAVMYFTDGPCSAGEFGQIEQGRDDVRYAIDMARLAERFGEQWKTMGLDSPTKESVLQIFALPHAEKQGLDEILRTVPQARLDEWATRFKR